MALEQFQEEEVVEPNIAYLQLQTLPVFPQESSGLLSRSIGRDSQSLIDSFKVEREILSDERKTALFGHRHAGRYSH